jgi:DNA repair photolyase
LFALLGGIVAAKRVIERAIAFSVFIRYFSTMQSESLFDFHTQKAFERKVLPVLGEQKDIRYYSTHAKSVLNDTDVTGMGFWSINPYVGCAFGCAYCYARYAHRYVIERNVTAHPEQKLLREAFETLPPWLAFERQIFVKENAADVLRRTLRHGSEKHLRLINGEGIGIGTATDPYQPAERRFRITRGILEVLAEHERIRVWIITKSPLVTRDVDLLRRIGRHNEVSVHISLITVDRELARRLEPRAPTPDARLRALARLRDHGIDAGINVMPVLPGITDRPDQLEPLVKAVAEAGATHIAACALRLRSAARQRYLPFIEKEFPHLASRYRATYASSHHAGERYREGLHAYFTKTCARFGVRFGHRDDDDESESDSPVIQNQLALTL